MKSCNRISHTHLDDVEVIIEENKDKEWILIHASASMKKHMLDKHEERLREKGLKVRFIS
jgi:methanogenic corrinoid protein MtbC1